MVTVQEGVREFQGIVERMGRTMERLKARSAPQSDIYFWQALKDYYQRALEAREQGQPLVMAGMFPPHELFYAMDIPYYVAENHAIMEGQSASELREKLFDTAEAYGLPTDLCSPHRAAVGLTRLGMQPRPDLVVSTATTCDQTLKLYELLANVYGVPCFLVDSPYRIDEAGLNYARQDIKDLITFLEERTGRRLDYDRLREVLRLSKEAYDYWEKLYELRKSVPCPVGGRAGIKDLTLIQTSCGTQIGVDYFKARYQELKEKVEQGEGVVPEEKHRIAWLYVLPLFDLSIADWLEQEFGAVIVVDSFGYAASSIDLNPEDPIDFLVKKPLKRGFVCRGYAPNDYMHFVDDLAQVCQDMKADVAILLSHWSCQQYTGTIRMLKDEIGGRMGLPFMVLNGDLLDPRVVSGEEMKGNLADFFSSVVTG
jgi:benzoyl-CoA reductase/2-hydroxyglutaryl-CoA dehydratase subunit BcrC/BadD/HgdB